MRDGFVKTAHGRIHYLEDGSGPPLVLLHSNGWSAYEFEANIPAFARQFRVIAWDMPGHGDSEPIREHYSVENYTDALRTFLDALGLHRVTLGGSSIGGLITAAFGVCFAERADRLLIIETPLRTAAWWAAHWAMVEATFSIPTQSFDTAAPRFKDLKAPVHQRYNYDRNKAGAWTMMDVMWAGREYDLSAALEQIKQRSLLLFGDKGPVFDTMPDFQRLMPNATTIVMPDCGHFPMIDEPEVFSREVLTFLGDR